MTDTTKTLVTFLLDRSQSMSAIRESTIAAFNEHLKGLQEEKGDGFICEFTFLQFDSISLDKLCVAAPVKTVSPLTWDTFVPRGSTPLIDACYKTIRAVEESLTKRDDKPKIIICFQTDGEENVSKEYTWAQLRELISEKTALGWQFNFMGAGVDAYAPAAKMGINAASAMSYDHQDVKRTKAAFSGHAQTSRLFGTGQVHNTSYSGSLRAAAGDRFATKDLLNNGNGPDISVSVPVGAIDLTKSTLHQVVKSQSIGEKLDLNA